MEEGRQVSKRISYAAKFKREVIQCAQDKGNRKAAAVFGVDESNVRLWRKHKASIRGCEASGKKFTGPNKGRFPESDDAVFTFFQERRKIVLFVRYDLLREETIRKARSLNIPRSRFKTSKGRAIRFMWRMGLALRRRRTTCQKFPKDGREIQYDLFFKKDANYDVIFIGVLLCSIRHKEAMTNYFQNFGYICCTDGTIIPMGNLSKQKYLSANVFDVANDEKFYE